MVFGAKTFRDFVQMWASTDPRRASPPRPLPASDDIADTRMHNGATVTGPYERRTAPSLCRQRPGVDDLCDSSGDHRSSSSGFLLQQS